VALYKQAIQTAICLATNLIWDAWW